MDVRLVAETTWRYPEAAPVWLEEQGWAVALRGVPEEVIPRGVYESDAVGNSPDRLTTTVHDAFLSLDAVAQAEDDEASAALLAVHAQQHPFSHLLCQHGRPMWHQDKTSDHGCSQLLDSVGTACISVRHVRLMMDGLRGLEDLAYHVATRPKAYARPAQVEAALQWPLVPDHLAESARVETTRDGALFPNRCKQIVARSIRELQREALLLYSVEWIKSMRMQMVALAYTDLALYVYDFTVRVLDAANASDADLTTVCQHCGQPYQPRVLPTPGSAYCGQPSCQRARKRQNQRSSRLRRGLAQSTTQA